MSQTLAADMVRGSLAVFLERVERQQDFPREEARALLASCTIPTLVIERLWQLVQKIFDHGMEGKKLTFLVKEVVDVLELGIKAFAVACQRVKAADLPEDERAEGLASLKQAGQNAVEMRDGLAALLRRQEAPPRELDISKLPEGRGDRQAKEYIGLDELTARMLCSHDAR